MEQEKEERYINHICDHAVSLSEKITTNCNNLTEAINIGSFEPETMINVLTFVLDYLSDVYYLKRTFNRFCEATDTPASDVVGDTQIGVAIGQIDSFIYQIEDFIKTIDDSLINLRIMNKLTHNEFGAARKLITNIKELHGKHRELNWYGNERV
ncbi:MAG: hypothetical protein IJ364_01765 [Oscillospiraceae bacterium]|nr:hypothetical protein [Oscillospiraceae bacterium]